MMRNVVLRKRSVILLFGAGISLVLAAIAYYTNLFTVKFSRNAHISTTGGSSSYSQLLSAYPHFLAPIFVLIAAAFLVACIIIIYKGMKRN